MEGLFSGKVALVTGAGSGIGKATAILYAANGAKVIVSDVNEESGASTVQAITDAGGEASFVFADVSRSADCAKLVVDTIARYGRLDMACNNAGIGGENNPIGEMTIAGWDKVIAINLSSVFYCMRYQIPAMLETGGGAIVNMASILGQVGFANSAGYVAAKHGVLGLTKNAAIEYASKGIRVNAVGPGFISTPLLEKAGMDDDMTKMLISLHPIGRLGEPEEVAELVIFLCNPKTLFITGSYYPIDGGYLAQ